MDNIDQYLKILDSFAYLGDSISGFGILQREFGLMRLKNVYHYTDIPGFISIMTKQEFWASHIAFMNDRSEFLHGKELFRKKLNEKINLLHEAEQTVLQNALQTIDDTKSSGVLPTTGKDVFSISFTYNRDSLEMWRGYGKDSGIAIGFDWSQCHSLPGMSLIREECYKELLKKYDNDPEQVRPANNHLFFPIAVLYEDDKKSELADKAIEIALTCFRKQASISEDTAVLSASDLLSDIIFKTNPLLKHYGFRGEDECRFVDNYMTNSTKKYHIYYRNRGGIILPYVKYKMMDLDCRPLKQIPICEIVVGPGLKQQKVADSVKYFLERNNMEYLVDKVHTSSIPFVNV